MATPTLSGLHHLKIPVAHLATSLDWYQTVFGAEHLAALDHLDSDGARYAVILGIPDVPVPVELRWAPAAAAGTARMRHHRAGRRFGRPARCLGRRPRRPQGHPLPDSRRRRRTDRRHRRPRRQVHPDHAVARRRGSRTDVTAWAPESRRIVVESGPHAPSAHPCRPSHDNREARELSDHPPIGNT